MSKRPRRGLIDTSVVIDLARIPREALPAELAVSALTLAELAVGAQVTDDVVERAERRARLQRTESLFDVLSFDPAAARAYATIYTAVMAAGRKPRGRRAVDLLIAATALAADLPLYTKNPDDFIGLEELVEVVGIVEDGTWS